MSSDSDFSGSEDSNFEPMQSDFESDHSSISDAVVKKLEPF